MDNATFNYQYICRLLNIGANHAIIEGAARTREIILYITDLVRYVYDTRKSIVSLDEEYKAVQSYIEIHNLRGMSKSITIEKHGEDFSNIFIRHLSMFGYIVDDIENQIQDKEDSTDVLYLIEFIENEIALKKLQDKSPVDTFKIKII
jgi:two-component system, sensor histidine kinase YesM